MKIDTFFCILLVLSLAGYIFIPAEKSGICLMIAGLSLVKVMAAK